MSPQEHLPQRWPIRRAQRSIAAATIFILLFIIIVFKNYHQGVPGESELQFDSVDGPYRYNSRPEDGASFFPPDDIYKHRNKG